MSSIRLRKRPTLWSCIIMGTLLCLRVVNNAFIYPAILCGIILILLNKIGTSYSLLLFLLPFSNIYKTSPGQISAVTVLFVILVVRLIHRKKRILKSLLLSLVILIIYSFFMSGASQIINIGTMMLGFLFISSSGCCEEIRFEEAIYAFSAGIIITSVLSLFKGSFPIINSFISDVVMKMGESNYVNRFSGLQGNPNYYTMDISMALSFIVTLMILSKTRLSHIILFVALSFFGLMSISKSFILSWLAVLFFLLMHAMVSGGKTLTKTLLLFVTLAVGLYFFAFDIINFYFERFFGSQIQTVSDITTNRSEIWIDYLYVLFSDLKVLMVGAGINSLLDGKASHNTYIEIVYSLGIIGVFFYLVALRASYSCIKSKLQNIWLYVPIVILLIRLAAITALTYDNIWYYFSLICVMLMQFTRRNEYFKEH